MLLGLRRFSPSPGEPSGPIKLLDLLLQLLRLLLYLPLLLLLLGYLLILLLQLPLQALHIDPSLLDLGAHYGAVLALDLYLDGIVLRVFGCRSLLALDQLVLPLHLFDLNDDLLLHLYLLIELVLQLLDVSVFFADDVVLEKFVDFF